MMNNQVPVSLQHLTSSALRERAFKAIDVIVLSCIVITGRTLSLFEWSQREPDTFQPNLLDVEILEKTRDIAQTSINDAKLKQLMVILTDGIY